MQEVLSNVTSRWWSHGNMALYGVTITCAFLRKNNIGDHVVERTALPDHLIKNVTGKIVFQAQHVQVCLVNFDQQCNIVGYTGSSYDIIS